MNGAIALITDDDYNTSPQYLYSKFYNFYDRVKVAPATGLQLAYTGANVLLPNGNVVALAPGVLNLPASSTVRVFINDSGAVASAASFPDTCIPLAIATTDSSSIVNVQDLRYQVLEQVSPVRLPATASPFLTGEIKTYSGPTAPPGWLLCQGQALDRNSYPALFAVIGYTYGGSGNSFRIPDMRGRTVVGSGQGAGLSNYALGSTGGMEKVKLAVSELPTHSHAVNDPGHNHGVNDKGHAHSISDSGHVHGISDPGHIHALDYNRAALEGAQGGGGAEISQALAVRDTPLVKTERTLTGISLGASASNISINTGNSSVSVNSNDTGISVGNSGGGGLHENRQPYIALSYIIKT